MRKRMRLAAAAGMLVLLSGCVGTPFAPGKAPAEPGEAETETGGSSLPACADDVRERLAPPFDTDGECWQVPRVTAAAGNVGIGFDSDGSTENAHIVDLGTGSIREIDLPGSATGLQVQVTPVGGTPMFLITGYEHTRGDALNAAGYRPFALGFDLRGSTNPAYRAEADWVGEEDSERMVTSTNVWADSAVLDIAAGKWAEVDPDNLAPREIGPYRHLSTIPDRVAFFGGNLVHVASERVHLGGGKFALVNGAYAVGQDGSLAWTNLTETPVDPSVRPPKIVAGYLGRHVLLMTAAEEGKWQVAWYDGITGEHATPKPADLAGLGGGTPEFIGQGPLMATADGRHVVLATVGFATDFVAVVDVEAGTATQIASPNDLTFTTVAGNTVYLQTQHGKDSATHDLAAGETKPLPTETLVPFLVTDKVVLFNDDRDDHTLVVTR
ncbi:hypothetical protein [Enemella sp. A6]|uniref:hypothetical protein n=1 Tax=Enemella sp. A6 TaxID=3440152 RepID=UPI003EBE2CA1